MKWRALGFLVVVGVFAVGLLVSHLNRYHPRDTAIPSGNPPTPVIVAKQFIPKGTPGSLVLSQSMYAPTTLPLKDLEVGAFGDPSYLRGRASVVDISPGQQLLATDFTASAGSRG